MSSAASFFAALLAFMSVTGANAADVKNSPDKKPDAPGIVEMSPEQQKTIGLRVGKTELRHITEPVSAPGAAAFDERRVARLRPYSQGRVITLDVRPGDPVKAGQRLASLDIAQLSNARNAMASARASLHVAEADAQVAEAALHRGEVLARDGSLARAEVERRRAEVARARAGIETAQAQMAQAQAQVSRLDGVGAGGTGAMTSPIDGVVVSVGVTAGEVVDTTTEAFTVADLSRMLVSANIPERDIRLIRPGDPATVRADAYPGRIFRGRVASIGAQVEARTNTITARFDVENPDFALKAGMYVTLAITADLDHDAVTVPATSVQTVGEQSVVFTPQSDNRYARQIVSLGARRDDWIEVRSGIAANSPVVTDGSYQLKALLQKDLLGSTN